VNSLDYPLQISFTTLHSYALYSSSQSASSRNSFFSMNGSEMFLDTILPDPLATPDPSGSPEPPNDTPLVITLGMWNHLLHRLSSLEALLENRHNEHAETLRALDNNHETLKTRYNTLEREHYEQALQAPRSMGHQEPKIPDPPMFSGDRKELLPFLTKCQLKFEGQPSRFPTERSKILYTGSRLEGPAFNWFQPMITQYPSGATAPPELATFELFTEALTSVYGDPNLEATAVREIRRLHQTGSAAEYAARFESKKQFMRWNDDALRDQFYLNLKEELKDEIAPVGKPRTYLELKTLAIRLDARLYERKLERSGNNPSKPAPTKPLTSRPFTWATPARFSTPAVAPAPSVTTPNPSGGLRVPSHTPDGTVPMELGASGLWQLTEMEKTRRKNLGLCGYCGEKGHATLACPVAPPGGPRHLRDNRPPRFARQTAMNFALTQPESENADAQE
jgi:Ty3 transposon capsid-like protein